MKILLAGATGVLGRRLVPVLIRGGHQVIAATRSRDKVEGLRAGGAEPVVLDALDRTAVMAAVASARPDAIIHQMTALPRMPNLKKFDQEFAQTNRLRTEGTEYLLSAAAAAGVRRFVAQSYTGWPNARVGGRVKTEEDPLDADPPRQATQTLAAIKQLEAMVTGAASIQGIILRYGSFYGPGTAIMQGSEIVEAVRTRKFPVVGSGAGVWSFIHIDDAAEATRIAVERAPAGIYNVVDDDPAEVSMWLPGLAQMVGAKAPYHVPAWIGRLIIGEAGLLMMTQMRGASNAKAKRVFGWQPAHASWRDGFRRW